MSRRSKVYTKAKIYLPPCAPWLRAMTVISIIIENNNKKENYFFFFWKVSWVDNK